MCRPFIPAFLALVVVSFLPGCEAFQLRNRTARQSATLSDLQYKQVMANLALIADNPSALPFYSVAQTGKTTIQQNTTANTMVNWDLLTVAGRLFDRFFWDKGTIGLMYNQQNIEEWDTVSALDPMQLILMQGLYRKALGYVLPPSQDAVLEHYFFADVPATTPSLPLRVPAPPAPAPLKSQILAFNPNTGAVTCARIIPEGRTATLGVAVANKLYFIETGRDTPAGKKGQSEKGTMEKGTESKGAQVSGGGGHQPDYSRVYRDAIRDVYYSIGSGWLRVGRWRDVPKSACYIGRHGKTFVWVTAEGLESLTNLTIAIIDVSTVDTSALGKTGGAPGGGPGGTGLRPRLRLNIIPQAIAPTP